MFLRDDQWTFWTISVLYLWNRFSRKWKHFSKNWSSFLQLKTLRLKRHQLHTKVLYQKPMLRQIEWWLQNELITKNGVLPVTTLFFWKFCLSLKTALIKTWFDVSTTQILKFGLFVSAEVLFDGTFSLWVSYKPTN